MTMTTDLQARVIDYARSQIGTIETPRNLICYWDQVYPSGQGQAWCGAFVTAAWLHCGIDIRPLCSSPYYVPALEAWAKNIGAWVTRAGDQEDGDLTIYGFGRNSGQHVGLAWRDEHADGYRAIEGNTSPGSAGSQANGGGVYVRYRSRASIRGWVSMRGVIDHYGLTPQACGEASPRESRITGALDVDGILGPRTVQEMQQRLGVSVDGKAGRDTWSALQRHHETPADGVISHQYAAASQIGPALVEGWEHDGQGAGGSTVIRALQQGLNVPVDGLLGPHTVRALQAGMNRDVSVLR